jgi:flagellar hook-associated protein 3 FlgL
MRISTSQIYDAGALNIQRNQSALFKLQNQISTGRRMLTPADDPVAAAQALVVTQSQSVTAQHIANQKDASSQLSLVDSQLDSLTGLLQSVRDRVVQAGNTTLNNSDRESIATELESRLSEMLGIANSDNGSGDYLFSGYQGATLPFAIDGVGTIVPPATTRPFAYSGDAGERLLQVSSARQMAVNVAGSDVFMSARQGNGSFVAATGDNVGGGVNQGTAIVDAGSVLDQQKWQLALNSYAWSTPTSPALQIRFSVAAGVTSYQLYDVSTPAVPVAVSVAAPFTPGQSVPLATTNPPAATVTDFGSQVIVQGQPADGDTFTVKPSTTQSLFQTLQNVIGILRSPVGSTTYTTTQLANDLGGQLTNIDQALDSVSQVQATVGTRMSELDSLGTASSDLAIQFASTLSDLQDLDYVKALSDYAKQQINLEAAEKSFIQISGLSLFNYL